MTQTALPRINKKKLSVSGLNETGDEKAFWLSQSITTRLNAIEQQRRMVYGTDRTASRINKCIEVIDLTGC